MAWTSASNTSSSSLAAARFRFSVMALCPHPLPLSRRRQERGDGSSGPSSHSLRRYRPVGLLHHLTRHLGTRPVGDRRGGTGGRYGIEYRTYVLIGKRA